MCRRCRNSGARCISPSTRRRWTGYPAQFLGGDLHANGGLKQDGTYALDLGGHIAVDAARGLDLHGPAAQVLTRMSGSAPYALNVRGAKGRLPEVKANSDLTGLALDFPAPFNKPVGTPMPLRFAVSPAAARAKRDWNAPTSPSARSPPLICCAISRKRRRRSYAARSA